MGLAERRFIKKTEEGQIADLIAVFKDLTGATLTVEVDWDAVSDLDADRLCDIANAISNGVEQAIRDVGKDAMGKDALKAGLKTVRLFNAKAAPGETTFKDEVLLIARPWRNGGWDANVNSDEVIRILEAGL
jgi:hypothetical protein